MPELKDLEEYFMRTKKVVFSTVVFAALTALAACSQSADPTLVPKGTPSAVDLVGAPSAVVPTSTETSTPTTPPAVDPNPVPAEPPLALSLKEQIAKLEKSGQVPTLDRTSSLLGIDANNNGVRDDIEAYINSLGFTPAQVRAAMQKAKILQQTLTVNTKDPAAVQQLGEKSMASTNCLGDTFTAPGQRSQVSQMLESYTMNTKTRVMQYLGYNSASSGSVTRLPDGDTCDK